VLEVTGDRRGVEDKQPVWVTGDRRGVEDKQPGRVTGIGCGDDFAGQLRLTQLAKGPIGAVLHLDAKLAEHIGRRGRLSPTKHGKVPGASVRPQA
jgi:hypothetical protein